MYWKKGELHTKRDSDLSINGWERITQQEYEYLYNKGNPMRYFANEEGEAIFKTDNDGAVKGYLDMGCTEIDHSTFLEMCAYLGLDNEGNDPSAKPTVATGSLPTKTTRQRRIATGTSKPPESVTKPKPKATSLQPVIDAIKFCGMANIDTGQLFQKHIKFMNGFAVAFDGILAIGCPVAFDVNGCPRTDQLTAALKKIGESGSFTMDNNAGVLSVRGDRLRASVACIGLGDMPDVYPDPSALPVGESFRLALASAALLTVDDADQVHKASVLLRGGSVVGTDGSAMVEVWHGLGIPFAMAIPKKAINAISKANKPITSIGAGVRDNVATSFTAYFEDGSWIKTQLYEDAWPGVDAIMATFNAANPQPLPGEFFEACKTIQPFVEKTGRMYFTGSTMASHLDLTKGAAYDMMQIPNGLSLNVNQLVKLEDMFTSADLFSDPSRAFFFGDQVRAILMGFPG